MNHQQVSSVECLQRQDWSIEKAMLKNSCNFWMTHTRLNIYILKYYLTRISSALCALSFNFYFIFFIFFTFFIQVHYVHFYSRIIIWQSNAIGLYINETLGKLYGDWLHLISPNNWSNNMDSNINKSKIIKCCNSSNDSW